MTFSLSGFEIPSIFLKASFWGLLFFMLLFRVLVIGERLDGPLVILAQGAIRRFRAKRLEK